MWNTGDKNMKFKAPLTGKGETNFHIGNKIPDDFPSLHREHLRDSFQNMSSGMLSHCKINMANGQQGTHKLSDKDVEFAKPNILSSQHGGYQFADPNSFSTNLQTKGVKFQKSGLNNSESTLYHTGPSPQSNTLVGKYSQVFHSPHLMYGLSSQPEAGKYLSYVSEGSVHNEKVQADFNSKSMMNLAFRDFPPPNDASFGLRNASHGSERNSEFSESGICKTELGGHGTNFDGRNFSGEVCYVGTCTKAIKDDYCTPMVGIYNVSVNMTNPPQISAAMERNEAHGSHHYPNVEVQSSHYPWGNNSASLYAKDQENNESGMPEKPSDCKGALVDCARLNRSSNEAHASRKADGSDSGNVNSSLKEEASGEIGIMAHKPVAPSENQLSLSMDSTSKAPSIKVAPTITGKLWDGTLQLNTSTVVSAVAVFKSGEKASEVNWSKYVEVKGKVRLEAFEKFVQELPRSRTRALMVISIYWKAGSSETGFMGMKEVAKGYKEGQRVGYAQLCPGIDLYVCPRSDAIITILAKYGFFKGMAAVEEDQDSLIGCVIWRRSHPSSDVALKKTEKNEIPSLDQPLDSPSESAISNNAEQNSSITKAMDLGCNQELQDFKVPAGASSPLKSLIPDNENSSEMKNNKSTTVPNTVTSNSNNTAPVLEPLSTHVSSVTQQLPMSTQKIDTVPEDPRKCISPAMTQFDHDATLKKSQVGADPSLRILSGVAEKLENNRQSSANNEDDDLPEFDFGNAYGVPLLPDSRFPSSSQNQHPLGVPPYNQRLQRDNTQVNKSASVPMLLELPNVRPPPPNGAPHRSRAPLSLGLMHDINQKVSSLKEVGVPSHESQAAVQTIEPSSTLGGSGTDNLVGPVAKSLFMQKMVETVGPSSRSGVSEVHNSTAHAAKSSFAQRRPIWDDDDDMPEWCPPNVDNEQWPSMPALPPLPLPSSPPLQSMLPTISRLPTLSPFLAPPSASTQSGISILPPPPPTRLQYEQNVSHQPPPGILGTLPLDNNFKIHLQKRPTTRFGGSDWRDSPELNYSHAKRQRRVSGWDVKPWEVKSDPRHSWNERH